MVYDHPGKTIPRKISNLIKNKQNVITLDIYFVLLNLLEMVSVHHET